MVKVRIWVASYDVSRTLSRSGLRRIQVLIARGIRGLRSIVRGGKGDPILVNGASRGMPVPRHDPIGGVITVTDIYRGMNPASDIVLLIAPCIIKRVPVRGGFPVFSPGGTSGSDRIGGVVRVSVLICLVGSSWGIIMRVRSVAISMRIPEPRGGVARLAARFRSV